MATSGRRPPNIVIIMADQLTPFTIGAYGHAQAHTPHMDALAAAGTTFVSAYTNAPLCAPARFSFMSGQLITRIAAYDKRLGVPEFHPQHLRIICARWAITRVFAARCILSGRTSFTGSKNGW